MTEDDILNDPVAKEIGLVFRSKAMADTLRGIVCSNPVVRSDYEIAVGRHVRSVNPADEDTNPRCVRGGDPFAKEAIPLFDGERISA